MTKLFDKPPFPVWHNTNITRKSLQNRSVSQRTHQRLLPIVRVFVPNIEIKVIPLPKVKRFPIILLMCDKEAIEVQKILPFLSDTWPLCRIGRAVIRASQSCRQSCNKSQCPACGCRSHHSCTHAPQFSRSFPAREWGSVLQRQGACGQCP